MYQLILASTSPRRRDLLGALGLPFNCVDPPDDDRPRPGEAPDDYALRVAREKAEGAAGKLPPGDAARVILASDTVVALGNRILGKPGSTKEARQMLRDLSGHTHQVITAVALLAQKPGNQEQVETFTVSTEVTFRELPDAAIERYVATGEPMDKAGAYAIQAGAAHMVQRVEGCYTNVVGLPVAETAERLKKYGLFA